MSNSKRQGYEEVDSDGVLYLFKADFGFLASLQELTGSKLFTIAEEIPAGDPEVIRDVLVSSLVKKSGDDVDELSIDSKRELIEDFITRHGLQECSILANHMMSNAMIGDLKKNQIDRHQSIQSLMNHFVISRSTIFKNHAYLWGYLALIFGTYQCISIKLLEMPIVSKWVYEMMEVLSIG